MNTFRYFIHITNIWFILRTNLIKLSKFYSFYALPSSDKKLRNDKRDELYLNKVCGLKPHKSNINVTHTYCNKYPDVSRILGVRQNLMILYELN